MLHRESDPAVIKITREIPLWGILTVAGTFAIASIGFYIKLDKLIDVTGGLAQDVKTIISRQNAKDVKDTSQDEQIAAIRQQLSEQSARITSLESKKP